MMRNDNCTMSQQKIHMSYSIPNKVVKHFPAKISRKNTNLHKEVIIDALMKNIRYSNIK